jgi:hypothetical protein
MGHIGIARLCEKRRGAHAGTEQYYWAVATNRATERFVLWPERGSREAAIHDVRAGQGKAAQSVTSIGANTSSCAGG